MSGLNERSFPVSLKGNFNDGSGCKAEVVDAFFAIQDETVLIMEKYQDQ